VAPPELAEVRAVGVAERDPAEREELLLRELSGLVEERALSGADQEVDRRL